MSDARQSARRDDLRKFPIQLGANYGCEVAGLGNGVVEGNFEPTS